MSIDTQDLSDRLSPRREVGLAAIALSIAAHVLIGVSLAALWVPPALLSSVTRRTVEPTDVDVLDEPGSDAPIADVAEKDEDLPQGPQGAETESQAPAAQAAPPKPAVPTAPAPPPPPTHAVAPRPREATSVNAPPAEGPAPSAGPATSGTAPAQPGEPDGGGGGTRPELPSVMARFTHDIAEWGAGVPDWQTAPIGDAGSIVVTIAVGDEGKLDKQHDPFGGDTSKLPPLLVESVKRTKSALVTKLGSRNVLVEFKVGAVVSDVAPPEGNSLQLSFDSYDVKKKKGGSTFVLGTGRRVTFTVEVLKTRALTDPP